MNEPPNEHLLAVDIGNNQIKLGLLAAHSGAGWPEPKSVFQVASSAASLAGLAERLPPHQLIWCVATVHREAERRLAEWVAEQRPGDRYQLLQNQLLPIEIRVDQPERVGTDRLLAAVAVNGLRQADRAAIIIDAGTAITVDLVSADGAFQGGVILPGFGMMARALARDTDLLPLVEGSLNDQPPAVVGKSTVAAIRSGLYWGSVGAVCELVRRIAGGVDHELEIFVAGGDAARLAPYLPATAQVVPELVLSGIALAWRALPQDVGWAKYSRPTSVT
ncbi:MAG: type III pantothenate kinase [Planctomycetota bacterium]|nr:type III pantothenate kinase [Planctomycetota bacterium]